MIKREGKDLHDEEWMLSHFPKCDNERRYGQSQLAFETGLGTLKEGRYEDVGFAAVSNQI